MGSKWNGMGAIISPLLAPGAKGAGGEGAPAEGDEGLRWCSECAPLDTHDGVAEVSSIGSLS